MATMPTVRVGSCTCLSVLPISVSQCRLSVPPISVSQCHLSVPVSAAYQCQSVLPISAAYQSHISVPRISAAAFQYPSLMPVNAHQCHLPVPPHQCPSGATYQCESVQPYS
ncbi:unnamed protein product, partial [Staurois parvus]